MLVAEDTFVRVSKAANWPILITRTGTVCALGAAEAGCTVIPLR